MSEDHNLKIVNFKAFPTHQSYLNDDAHFEVINAKKLFDHSKDDSFQYFVKLTDCDFDYTSDECYILGHNYDYS